MSGKIQLTPNELKAQAAEMSSLQSEYEAIFSGISSSLRTANQHWSGSIVGNFSGKISSARNSFSYISTALEKGAQIANSSATTYESVDDALAKLCSRDSSFCSEMKRASNTKNDIQEVNSTVNLKSYFKDVSDAEYAKLCYWWGYASEKKNPEKAFLKYLEKLPPNDPLHNLTKDQIQTYIMPSGLAAVSISDGNGNALVIFAGTQGGDKGDLWADAQLALNISSKQAKEANAIINSISKNNSNIQVTGHSLGGYLATSVTIHNTKVSRCVAFDPPGRRDNIWNNLTNGKQTSKVTTYEARGSQVSSTGHAVGHRISLKVKSSGHYHNLTKNHDLNNIYEALGGDSEVYSSWNPSGTGGGGGNSW